MLAEVSGIDVTRKEVIADGRRIGYDYLVLATGARHAYFGHNDWAAFAPGLKTIDDATYLRRRILLAFERAENETDVDERRRLMTFVVVGGGPTGVEMAGAIAELAKRALASDFQSIDPQCASIVLIEGAQRLLTPFDPSLSHAARRSLNQLGVDVRLGAAVTDCSCEGVRLGDEFISTRTIIWAAGVMASPAGRWLGAEVDRAGRVKVRADLSVPGHPDVFVIGDTAAVTGADGAMLPGIAPVAKQQGQYVARALIARYQGRTAAVVANDRSAGIGVGDPFAGFAVGVVDPQDRRENVCRLFRLLLRHVQQRELVHVFGVGRMAFLDRLSAKAAVSGPSRLDAASKSMAVDLRVEWVFGQRVFELVERRERFLLHLALNLHERKAAATRARRKTFSRPPSCWRRQHCADFRRP